MREQSFFFHLKLPLFLRNLDLYPDIFDHVGKQFLEKVNLNFKISDVTEWASNNYNTRIAHCIKMQRQLGNEIWSANRIYHDKIFLDQSYAKCNVETSLSPLDRKSKFNLSQDQQPGTSWS